MEHAYYEASKRHGWNDEPRMRKRWKQFQEHKKKCRQRSAYLHHLYSTDRSAWETELKKLSPAEQIRQHNLEKCKAELLQKLR